MTKKKPDTIDELKTIIVELKENMTLIKYIFFIPMAAMLVLTVNKADLYKVSFIADSDYEKFTVQKFGKNTELISYINNKKLMRDGLSIKYDSREQLWKAESKKLEDLLGLEEIFERAYDDYIMAHAENMTMIGELLKDSPLIAIEPSTLTKLRGSETVDEKKAVIQNRHPLTFIQGEIVNGKYSNFLSHLFLSIFLSVLITVIAVFLKKTIKPLLTPREMK